MVGGTRKPWLVVATWIWCSVFIGPATWFFSTAAAGQDGNAPGGIPLLIRPVVGFYNVGADGLSTDSEPTVRIVGRDGLCAEVSEGYYHKGNSIRLWTCKSNDDVSQLWTVRKDGTIRSNGKCMTAYGYAPGNYVMIYACGSAAGPATRWEIWGNGTIVNPRAALALSAESGRGATLTLQKNVYASIQGWQASNQTAPAVASIVGYKDLCMEANGAQMWLETCSTDKEEQKWALYPDGSIRPSQSQDQCLTCESDAPSTVINIASCGSASSGLRWAFTEEGTILNLHNGLVMDVKGGKPGLREIIIYGPNGRPNQKWHKLL